ncbi:MAG TPA: hemolysin family protein [Miltoncostaea sp.]|nr:hemolysin family protein [Miltoncostaea sp.]
MTNAAQIVGALLLVLLNGFFVAAEFSLARARTTRIEQLADSGRGGAVLVQQQIKHIDRYLAACQLGITLASLGLGWLGEPAFAHIFEPFFERIGFGEGSAAATAVIIAFVIITVLHVVVGELAPKTIAIQRAEPVALGISRPLEWFRWIFSPFIYVMNGAGNALVRALGVEPATESELASTPEDLQILIAQSEEGGALEPEEADMLEGVFGLQESLTRDIMTPRPEVTTLAGDAKVRAGLSEALNTRHSRFPVLNGDGVLGIVHLGQLARGLLEKGEDTPIRDLAGAALFVPETQPVDDLLRQLQARRASLAVVLDEYGDFAGVVTVEDVIEEIVGEIEDERDRAPAVDQRPDGRLMVRGHVPLEDLHDHGVELIDDTVTSVGGLVFTRLGRLPRTGDSVTADGWQLTVEATRGTRVVLVAIEPAEASSEAPDREGQRARNGDGQG